MTLMLASVTGPEEAEAALAGGADVIDLKQPARGVLGAVDVATVAATVARIGGRRKVSAVAGDAPPEAVLPTVAAMAEAGVDYVKIGLFPGGDPVAGLQALAPLAGRVRLVGVLFADLAPNLALLPALAQAGFAGAMLDTARKDRGRLLEQWDLPAVARFVAACRAENLTSGLAGGLEPPDIPRLLVLQPWVLGFRGALCAGGRSGTLDLEAVRRVRALIPPEAAVEEGGVVDWRVLAARGYAPDPHGDPAVTDRVFVRDLVLPAFIGAYARERDAPQRVRFVVEVLVSRSARATQDLRDIYSYDIISDGIRMLLAGGHVDLVETLAERIAALLLGDPRVVKVLVQVEKLDTGSGVVGVAIERSRATMPAVGELLWLAGSGGGRRP